MLVSLWDVTGDPQEVCQRLPLTEQNEMFAKQEQLKELSSNNLVWIVYYKIKP
jgi:hypothetical protein